MTLDFVSSDIPETPVYFSSLVNIKIPAFFWNYKGVKKKLNHFINQHWKKILWINNGRKCMSTIETAGKFNYYQQFKSSVDISHRSDYISTQICHLSYVLIRKEGYKRCSCNRNIYITCSELKSKREFVFWLTIMISYYYVYMTIF